MNTTTQQRTWFQEQIDAMKPGQLADAPDWLDTLHKSAKQSVSELPIPDRKEEAWRYTPLGNLLKHSFSQIGDDADKSLAATLDKHLLQGFSSYRIVFINGRFNEPLSHLKSLPAGVTITGLGTHLSNNSKNPEATAIPIKLHTEDMFVSLNSAMISDGWVIHVNDGISLDRPIEVIYLSSAGNRDQPPGIYTRNSIRLDKDTNASLVERFINADTSCYFHNNLTEVTMSENASLGHLRIQDDSPVAYHLSNLFIKQAEHSSYRGNTLSLGAAWARTEYKVDFIGEQADCQLQGLYLAGDQQLSDFHLDVRHSAPYCKSRARYKGILQGRGRAVFDGHILVDKHALGSDARLTNDNLLLSRDAEVDTKPQLEIYTDDVKCSHGTTVGQLDEDHVFYLRSRGIGEDTARNILCLGFALEMVNSIEFSAIREQVYERLTSLLERTTVAVDSP